MSERIPPSRQPRRWRVFVLAAALLAPAAAPAADWPPPGGPVEFVVPSGPGSGMDTATRTIKHLLEAARLLSGPSIVINKAGAGGSIGYQYLNQHTGSARHLALASPGLITNQLMGIGKIAVGDVTPVSTVFSENIVFMVRADSNIRDGKALIARLRERPGAVSWGIATALGGANHIAAASVLKAAGIDVSKAHYVVYKAGSAALVGLLSGEVDIVPVATLVSLPQVAAGKVRVIAISSPRRLGSALADVPTWKELGVDAVYTSWRALIAPGKTPEADVRAASEVFRKMVATPEWQAHVEKNYWISDFLGPDQTRRFFAEQLDLHEALLRQLGLTR